MALVVAIRTAPLRRWSPSCASAGCGWSTSPPTSGSRTRRSTSAGTAPHGAPQLLADRRCSASPSCTATRSLPRSLVANPGCYSTAAILALAPLARAGLIADAVVDAKSGVSGAGREANDTHALRLRGRERQPVRGRRPPARRPRSTRSWRARARVTFMPHLLPLDQGLLASCYVTPARAIGADELARLFAEAYGGEPFIELAAAPPGVRDVRDTNICRIHVTRSADGRVLVLRRDRQPLEGRRRPGGPEPERDARPRRDRRAGRCAATAEGGR